MSTDLHTLSGAYSVNALSPAEAVEFRKHLEDCPACRDEVAELQAAAATLGASEAVAPPAHLRARVLAAADAMPQLPPKVVPAAVKTKTRWTPRLLVAAAAVVLVVAGGLVVNGVHNTSEPSVATSVSQVFHAPDAHTAVVDTANGGKLKVATSQKLDEMAVDTADLKPLGDKQVYQLWSIAGGKPASAGVVGNLDKGKAMPMPGPGAKVAITIEPAGGSAAPTSTPIVTLDPRSV